MQTHTQRTNYISNEYDNHTWEKKKLSHITAIHSTLSSIENFEKNYKSLSFYSFFPQWYGLTIFKLSSMHYYTIYSLC